METVVVLGRLVLAALLMAASLAKLRDLAAFSRAAVELRIPKPLIRVVSVVVPTAELVVGVGMLFTPTLLPAAVLGLVLLVTFTGLLTWNLASGRRPACNCFGSSTEEPISWWSVGRNGVMIAIAAMVVLRSGGPGIPAWLQSTFDYQELAVVAGVSLCFCLLLGAAVIAGVSVSTRPVRVQRRRNIQAPVVRTSLSTLRLRDVVDPAIAAGLPLLIVRTDPDCAPCRALVPRIQSWQDEYAGLLEILVVVTGAGEPDAGEYEGVHHVMRDGGGRIASQLGLDVTPSALLVTGEDTVTSPVAAGGVEIGALVTSVSGEEDSGLLLIGDPAGGSVFTSDRGIASLSDFRGSMVLLVFWDPWCGFCQAMLPELRLWETEQSPGQRLVVSSLVSLEVAGVLGFQNLVHDPEGKVMRTFGADGTPSAVLVDAAGRVASEVANGRDEVMRLADRSNLLTRLAASQPQ